MSSNGRNKFVPVVTGDKGAEYTGWQESLSEIVQRVRWGVRGLRERVDAPARDVSIWPSAIGGVKYFQPETAVVQIDTAQNNGAKHPCNFIVRGGKKYTIPVIFPGPGVFVARWLKFALYMRLFDPNFSEVCWVPIVTNTQSFPAGNIAWTTVFSVFPKQPAQAGFIDLSPALNFCWNASKPGTGRAYSSNPISHVAAAPRTWLPVGSPAGFALPDGDMFDFRGPWVFERDGQATVDFIPITDFLQFDSSLSGTNGAIGLPYDDRQHGKRDQTVKVQVEMHGYRFETMQDAMHAGALTQKW